VAHDAAITREEHVPALRRRRRVPVTFDRIARRAYELYLARGDGHYDAEDWSRAERELRGNDDRAAE